MAHYYKDANGVKHRVAGLGLIDRVLSLSSRHAIANDVVTAELNSIKDDLTDMITVEHVTVNFGSVAANASVVVNNIDITKSGYTPISVNGDYTNHNDTWIARVQWTPLSNSVTVATAFNGWTKAQDVNGYLEVVYLKNSFFS